MADIDVSKERGEVVPWPTFHAKDGLTFTRHEDASVWIKFGQAYVELDASTWASAVASMSLRGENSETFGAALAFHREGCVQDNVNVALARLTRLVANGLIWNEESWRKLEELGLVKLD